MSEIIVVGGGLSGLSAAHTVLEHGGRVVLLEKNSFLGGNSTKATSGINGALTKTQIKLKIEDSSEAFYADTARSARDLLRAPLVKVLTGNSASGVEWLQEKFGLDLSLVSRLGGHSFPRTHRGKEKFPGMTITYALMEKLEDLSKAHSDAVRIVTKARATKLIYENGTVIGVEYEKDGQSHKAFGPVILATGGYAADFAEDGLIKKHRGDIFHLPTTNGDWSTGDGLKMATAIGGNAIDLEKVQVHPTGLVDPNEPDAKVKFLAAEALRGVGGLLLTNDGQRFCDELGHRDYVTGEMWKAKKAPYRLVLNGAAAKEIEWHCKHYQGRGLMKKFNSGEALAKEMGISVSVLDETFKKYNQGAKDNKDPFGKKYFHNLPFDTKDEFYVAIVTPVIHYCMGGLEINADCEIQAKQGTIPGLYGCGEVAGGVHGANRLGGSSLLGCVVFGRVAGDAASRYLFRKLLNEQADPSRRLATIAGQVSQGFNATVSNGNVKVHVQVGFDGQSAPAPAAPKTVAAPATPAAAAPAPAAPKKEAAKEYTLEEVAKHKTEKDCWVVVNGQVLNVSSFLADHPGGKKAILIYAGKDASEEFNMMHKPDVIAKYAPDTVIGTLKGKAKL